MLQSGPKSRVIAVFLILFLLLGQLGLSPAPALAAPVSDNSGTLPGAFKDVPQSNPNFAFINFLNKRGLLNGFPDGTFQPAAGLTRAEAAAVMAKAAGLNTGQAKTVFKDVSPQFWAAASIAAAKDAGLLKGYPDGTFRPQAKLTRAEGITLILKLSNQPDPGVELPVLADVSAGHWAAKPIAAGLASEMVGLSADNKHFMPTALMTRGSLARALAVLLTKDPAFYETSLSNKLTVVTGPVTVTRSGSNTPEPVSGSTELQPGDAVNTGTSGKADITFPDGTGLRLEKGSQFFLKEARGRLYIKTDGTPGTAVEWLAVDLKSGKLFGALATGAATSGNSNDSTNPAVGTAAADPAQPIGLGNLAQAMGLGNLSENRVRIAAAAAKPLPWWKQSGVKRTKVKIDMPTGVAAIRGTFWENIVKPDGSFGTTLLTGSAEITAGGRTVGLAAGQRTEVSSSGAPPAPPAPMTPEDNREWVTQKLWAQERAAEIKTQQERTLPPPPPAENPEQQLQPEQPQNPPPGQPVEPVIPDIASMIESALSDAQKAAPVTQNSSHGSSDSSSGGVVNVPVTGVQLDVHSLNLIAGASAVTVTAKVYPDNATNNSVTWTSSNTSVAYVSGSMIVPVSAGSAVITVKTADGGFEDTCEVIVTTANPNDGGSTPPPSTTMRISSLELASIASDGTKPNETSGAGEYPSSVSQDGRYVAFFSYASNLVAGDTNGQPDVFVHDRSTGKNVLVSKNSYGIPGNNDSRAPVISADGRYVVFSSYATNLVDVDTNGGIEDIFRHDRDADNDGVYDETEPGAVSTVLVSVATDGTQANNGSAAPGMSADGNYITFYSAATNLVPNDTNGLNDVFVRDMQMEETRRVSVSSNIDGVVYEANADCWFSTISPNGRYVAYQSGATTLVPGVNSYGIFVRDLVDDTTTFLLQGSDPDMSYDGRFVAYSRGDDIFIRDRDKNATGIFDQVYADTKATVAIDGGLIDDYSYQPTISWDGRYVAYTSHASNLVKYDTNKTDPYWASASDIFVWDSANQVTKRISIPLTLPGGEGNYDSWYQAMSGDGSTVAFHSGASNLVTVDTGGSTQVYVASLTLDSPLDTVAPPAPTELQAAESGPSWFKLNWNAAADNTSVIRYHIYRGAEITGPFTKIASVPGYVYSCWDTGLSPGTTYNYYVLAEDEDGNISVPPAAVAFTTVMEESIPPEAMYLAAGEYYSLARLYDGTARAWGSNSNGALGDGTSTDTPTPLPVVYNEVYFSDISALSAYSHTLAVRNDGTVWAWGSNDSGELGITPDTADHTTLRQVTGLANITAIAAGYHYSLALGSDGTVWSWGKNSDGQLGNRFDIAYDAVDGYTPMRVVSPDGTGYLTNVVAVSAGSYSSVALRADGTVWAWGSNYDSVLGNGSYDYNTHPVPTQVQGLPKIAAVSAGYNHYLAVDIDGNVWAWGRNYDGQIGDGTYTERFSPVQVTGITGVTAISAGYLHTMALKGNGTVWTWGANDYGKLGNGDFNEADSLIPVQVVEIGGTAAAIETGTYHNMIMLDDGTVLAWGANHSGQLGIGTSDYDSHPIPMMTLVQQTALQLK